MQKSFKILEWDSKFFGLKVARINKNFFLNGSKDMLLKQLKENEVKLAYYISDIPLENIQNDIYNFLLVSRRVFIEKKLINFNENYKNIHPFDKSFPDEEIYGLAERAGAWSRFQFDPCIESGKVKELYRIWIRNFIINKKNSELLIYKDKTGLKGFVAVSFDPPHGTTPLFAVSKEAEGKGVSFALMRAADAYLYKKGCTHYTSATQADNKAAITIFKRHGLEISPEEYVYHLWKKE